MLEIFYDSNGLAVNVVDPPLPCARHPESATSSPTLDTTKEVHKALDNPSRIKTIKQEKMVKQTDEKTTKQANTNPATH